MSITEIEKQTLLRLVKDKMMSSWKNTFLADQVENDGDIDNYRLVYGKRANDFERDGVRPALWIKVE